MANLAQGSSNSSSCLHQSSKVWIVALWHYWLCSCTTAVIIMNITVNNVKIIENLTFAEAASLLPRSPMVISPQRFKFGQLSKESLVVCHDKSFLFSLQQHDKKTNTIEGQKELDPPLLYVLCSRYGLFWLQAVLVCLARGVHLRRIYSKYFKYVKIQNILVCLVRGVYMLRKYSSKGCIKSKWWIGMFWGSSPEWKLISLSLPAPSWPVSCSAPLPTVLFSDKRYFLNSHQVTFVDVIVSTIVNFSAFTKSLTWSDNRECDLFGW